MGIKITKFEDIKIRLVSEFQSIGVLMFSLLKKIKDIKTLILTHLQQLRDESQLLLRKQEVILRNDDSILSNNISLLNASKHLIELFEKQSQENQKLRSELKQQIQYLLYQDQQHRDALLMLISRSHAQPLSISQRSTNRDPDTALMAYLFSYLPSRNALDIGANVGDVSEDLLKVGYEVYAFEPFPPVFQTLKQRLEHYPNFHPIEAAVGLTDDVQSLYIATLLEQNQQEPVDPSLYSTLKPHEMWGHCSFSESNTVQVKVRSLESLHASQEIPSEVSLVKIDTEGFDLEVIRGMGSFRYPVVISEFWGTQLSSQRPKVLLENTVKEMKHRGYYWYLVICRDGATGEAFFYSNYDGNPTNYWGNAFFFQSYETFSYALKWCLASLPQTYVFN